MPKFPDFIIVGSMKCGTTALWRNLNEHPQITMGKNAEDPKRTSTEIRFWNNDGPYHVFSRGTGWYQGCFSNATQLAGEKCANYIESPMALRRISSQIPGVKLILCVREPVDRMLSEFWMHHLKPVKIKKFKRFSAGSSPRKRGQYFQQLERAVFPFFSDWRAQLYFLVQERMAANTTVETNKLFAWLGVDPYTPKTVEMKFVERDRPAPVAGAFRNWKTDHGCDMDPGLRAELRKFYKPWNRKLFEIMGGRVDEWF